MFTVGNIVIVVLAIAGVTFSTALGIGAYQDYQKRKHCNHLCLICKYRDICDWDKHKLA